MINRKELKKFLGESGIEITKICGCNWFSFFMNSARYEYWIVDGNLEKMTFQQIQKEIRCYAWVAED